MQFYISTTYDNGSGMEYKTKEEFLKEIELMIDDCIANGGTSFDVTVESDASCFAPEGYKEPEEADLVLVVDELLEYDDGFNYIKVSKDIFDDYEPNAIITLELLDVDLEITGDYMMVDEDEEGIFMDFIECAEINEEADYE